MSRRLRAISMGVLSLSAALLLAAQPSSAAPESGLPDLGMAPLDDLVVATTPDGQQQLRFSATVVNVGAEPFQLAATRPSTDSGFTVSQRIRTADGSQSSVPVDAELVFGGDGHAHWHVKALETYVLERLDNGVNVGTGSKGGFCFFDTDPYRLSLPGAPASPQFDESGCGDQASLEVSMGLSIGWGDEYRWTLPDQYIDITGLERGKYRLRAIADAFGAFTEADDGNNETWVDLQLSSRHGKLSVKVLPHGHGPAA